MPESPNQSTQLDITQQFLSDIVKEHRANRRWKIVFRVMFFFLILLFLVLIFAGGPQKNTSKPHTAIVELRGTIMDGTRASAKYVGEGLKNAFKNPHSKAVILYIDSGGGSPVQSSTIYDHIIQLRKQYPEKKIYAVCADVCASGAYYIASAADEIYANKSSIIGSIGVVMNGFGFVETIQKLGIERRLFTSGDNKGYLDPFSPLSKDQVKHNQKMLDIIHQIFINDVKQGRGDRLADSPELFTGLIWAGEESFNLGLIDGFGDINSVSRVIIKAEKVVDYTYHGDVVQWLSQNLANESVQSLASYVGIIPQGLH